MDQDVEVEDRASEGPAAEDVSDAATEIGVLEAVEERSLRRGVAHLVPQRLVIGEAEKTLGLDAQPLNGTSKYLRRCAPAWARDAFPVLGDGADGQETAADVGRHGQGETLGQFVGEAVERQRGEVTKDGIRVELEQHF